jgi:hypothetical protein
LGLTCTHFQTNVLLFQQLSFIAKAAHYIIIKPNVVEIKKILDTLGTVSLQKYLQRKVNSIVDQSGRTILDSTLLQLAYGAGDHDMCIVLESYFEKAFGKEAAKKEICRQLDEKFADENDESNDLLIKNELKRLLDTVILAISKEPSGKKIGQTKWEVKEETLKAIEAFRTGFDALHSKVINHSMHYRFKSTEESCEAYKDAVLAWQFYYNKCALFEDGVLSKVLEHTPASVAQRFSQGLHYLQKDEPEDFNRSLIMKDKNHFYSFLKRKAVDFPLSSSCVDIIFGLGSMWLNHGAGTGDIHVRPSLVKLEFLRINAALNDFSRRAHQRQEQSMAVTEPLSESLAGEPHKLI